MIRGRLLVLVVLGLSLVLLSLFFFLSGGGGEAVKGPPPSLGGNEPGSHPATPELKKVVLFFLSEADELLHPEERVIVSGPTPEREAGRVVEELIKGSRQGLISPLPAEAQLRQVFLTKEGIAYVDFSREFSDRHPSGSTAEMDTVYCLVNSLAFNFKSIKKVFILVNGGEKETLGGHISLTEPFLPNFFLIAE
jgi:spore germination protein GerM